MAVTARFLADFSSFNQAVEKAEVKLTSFTSGASKVEKALARMTDQFSGRRVIQEATLMVKVFENMDNGAKLTVDELRRMGATAESAIAKLKALGSEVPAGLQKIADEAKRIPPELNNASTAGDKLSGVLGKASSLLGAFGIGLSVGALVSFGKSLFDAAGAVSDLSTATGVSTTGLQRFAYVGAGVGVSMEEIGRSVGTLSERLAGGDQSALSAVNRLGLSLDDLLKAGPEEAFIQIGEAVGRIEDPMQKNAVAADLFGGKLSKTLIPMLGDLRQAMEDVPKDALISKEQLQNADDFGDKLDQLTIRVKAWASTQLFPKNRIFEMQMPPDADLAKKVELLRAMGVAEKDNWAATELANQATEREKVAQDGIKKAMIASLPPVMSLADALTTLGKGLSFETFEADRAVAAQKKHADELVKLKKTIEDINAINRSAQAGTWAPTAGDLSASVDAYIARLQKADEIQKKIFANQIGSVTTTETQWNVGVQLDTKDAQETLKQLNEQWKGSLGGMLNSVVQGLPKLLQQAFTGGGGLKGFGQAITSQVGEALGSKLFAAGGPLSALGGKLSQGLGNLLGKGVGDALGLALPGIGQAIGSLIGPIMGKVFSALKSIGGPSKNELEGRAVVEDFEKQFGSVEDMINRVGDAYRANGKTAEEAQAAIQAMWAAEKLGAEATRLAVAAITEELKRQGEIASAISGQGFQSQDQLTHAADIANAAYQEMLRSGQYTQAQVEEAYRHYQEQLSKLEGAAGAAARAWIEAHKSSDDAMKASSEAMQSAENDLKDLIGKRDQLAKGIAAEAPEAIMGVIEAQQRGQLAVLDDEIAKKAEAYAKLAEETGQKMADAIVKALEGIRLNPITVPVVYSYQNGGINPNPAPPNPIPMANGGAFRVTKPTLFLAGEAGPEDAVFSGANKSLKTRSNTVVDFAELRAELAALRQQQADTTAYFQSMFPRDLARAVMAARATA